jgi:hypothetical protein
MGCKLSVPKLLPSKQPLPREDAANKTQIMAFNNARSSTYHRPVHQRLTDHQQETGEHTLMYLF